MDYEVFLFVPDEGEYERTGAQRRRLAFGLEKTGRIITSAALIMIAVWRIRLHRFHHHQGVWRRAGGIDLPGSTIVRIRLGRGKHEAAGQVELVAARLAGAPALPRPRELKH